MKNELREAFADRLRFYRSQHKTVGCKITHMVGVPLLALSFPVAIFNRRLAAQLQAVGWILQLTGHYVFEHNKPVFMEAADPLTAPAALVFVADEWNTAVLQGLDNKNPPSLLQAVTDQNLN